MNALALLCNLHAEGPATLSRLRTMGATTLHGVLVLPVDRLAVLLGAPANAERFLREGRALLSRIEANPMPEESPDVERTALRIGELEGLDAPLIAALAREGLHTLEDLARCEAGRRLALRLGLSLPRLIELQTRVLEVLESPRVSPPAGERDLLFPAVPPRRRLSPLDSPLRETAPVDSSTRIETAGPGGPFV